MIVAATYIIAEYLKDEKYKIWCSSCVSNTLLLLEIENTKKLINNSIFARQLCPDQEIWEKSTPHKRDYKPRRSPLKRNTVVASKEMQL